MEFQDDNKNVSKHAKKNFRQNIEHGYDQYEKCNDF